MKLVTWIVAIVLGAAATLSAATLKVPADFPTIAAALAAAAQGDTVQLAKGTYYENGLVVGVGITLKGSGATIDGNVAGVEDAILVINGDNATVSGVRFQNGNDAGDTLGQLVIVGNNARVSKCTFRGGEQCLVVVGDNALISGNRISNKDGGDFITVTGALARILKNTIINGDGEVVVNGNQATVSGNLISTIEDDGNISITGDDAVVTSNRSYNLDDDAINITGARAFVSKNTVMNISGSAIEITGDDALVTANKVTGTEDEVIYITGNRATILKNKITYVAGTGIYLTGDNYRIEGNRILDVADDADGIYVSQSTANAAAGGIISKNKLAYIVEQALDLYVTGATIEKNTVIYSGSEGEESIYISGNENLILNCTVKDNEDHGFEIRGNNNTLRGCKALGSHKDGFRIAAGSVGTLLDNCDAIDCGGEGLDNQDGAPGATNTSAIDCLFKDNHLDIADGGSGIVDLTGTDFDTGGIGTPSEVN